MAVVHLPSNKQTIMLAMDVRQHAATDVEPSRIVAAQNAAKAFLNDLPRHVRVVSWPSRARRSWLSCPRCHARDLVTAIDHFQLQRGTATGNGIVLSLVTLFPTTASTSGKCSGALGRLRQGTVD